MKFTKIINKPAMLFLEYGAKEMITKALEEPLLKQSIEQGICVGTFLEDAPANHDHVRLDRVSHACKKVWWDGDILYGDFETLPTSQGRKLEDVINKYGLSAFDIVICGCSSLSADGRAADIMISEFCVDIHDLNDNVLINHQLSQEEREEFFEDSMENM